jgi:hypothetical protein
LSLALIAEAAAAALQSTAATTTTTSAIGFDLIRIGITRKRREHGKHRTREGCASQLYRPAPRYGALGHTYSQVVEGSLLDLSPQHRWSFLVFGSPYRASLPTSANKIRTLL